VQDLVVVEVVVPDLDAGFLLEVLDRVFGDVVGPVVDVQDLLLFLARRGRGRPGGSRAAARALRGVLPSCHRRPKILPKQNLLEVMVTSLQKVVQGKVENNSVR
jgi:hypothetical protein